MDKVLGVIRTIASNFTRPADTTTYTAADVVADSTSAPTIINFPRAAREKGGSAIIQQAICVSSANVSTKPDLELWLFDESPAAVNDNAAFAPSDAELRTLVGIIAFTSSSFKAGTATSGAGGNAVCDIQNIGMPINCSRDDNALYGVLVVRNAYVPVSGERFDIRLKVLD